VEHFAHVSLVTELLGKKSLLSARDVDKLLAARARYGAATLSQDLAPSSPECPETADTGSSHHQARTRR
jgi:hypothetical protein